MVKHITRQSASFYLQAKEGTDKIKYMALPETAVIKSELQTTMAIVKKIDQYQIRTM